MPIQQKYVVDTASVTSHRAIPGREAGTVLAVNIIQVDDVGNVIGTMPITLTIPNPTDADREQWVGDATVRASFEIVPPGQG